jgi:hypothetical protein
MHLGFHAKAQSDSAKPTSSHKEAKTQRNSFVPLREMLLGTFAQIKELFE